MTEQTRWDQIKMMISRREKRRRNAQSQGVMAGLLAALGPGDICFDCGANVGVVTKALANTGATVISFEPDPLAFEALQKAVGDMPNVTLHNAAVGASDGTVTLMRDHHFDKNPLGRTVRSSIIDGGSRMEGEGVTVPLIDFTKILKDAIAKHGQITFLKIDIEGAEVDLLEAMEKDDLFQHIKLTVCETHERKFAALRARYRGLRGRIGAKYPADRVNLDWH